MGIEKTKPIQSQFYRIKYPRGRDILCSSIISLSLGANMGLNIEFSLQYDITGHNINESDTILTDN